MELIDNGLEEMIVEEDICLVYTAFEDFGSMQNKLEELNIEVKNVKYVFIIFKSVVESEYVAIGA